VCCGVYSAGAATPCGLTKADCPACPAGGLALTSAGVNDDLTYLTCDYGNLESGNTVTININCYQDAGVAQKSYQYYKTLDDAAIGSHVVTASFNSGKDPKIAARTWKEQYLDWDFALTGKYMATIKSYTPTRYKIPSDSITEKEASAINVKRIQQFTGCFASFSPGGVPAPQQQKLTGTIIATDIPYGKPRPLKYALVSYIRDDGKIDRTNTNDKGEYSFDTLLLPGKQYTINITLTYAQDKDYFTLGLYKDDSGKNPLLDEETDDFEPIVFSHRFTYRTDADLKQDLNLDDFWRQTGKPGNNPFGIMYIHHQEVLE